MTEEIHRRLEKMAEAAFFKLIARGAMICLVPLFGFFGTRVIQATDRVAEQLAETRTAVRLLQLSMDDRREVRDVQFSAFKSALDDHEGRIRTLERRAP